MTQDEVAMILGWQRATEADATERNVVQGTRHHQTADSAPCALWVCSDRRGYPMDWAWMREDLEVDELASQFRFLNDMIIKTETSIQVGDETRSFYRELLNKKHEQAMAMARGRRWSWR